MNFQQWMQQVDSEVSAICGLGSGDLADMPFRDRFEDGCDPAEVAQELLIENDFPAELL